MSIKATITVGASCVVSVEAENPVELIKSASQFTQLPSACGHCGSKDLGFNHRTAGDSNEYDYLTLKCGGCGASCDLGQSKAIKGAIFFKYNPKEATNVKDGWYKYWEQGKGSSAPSSSNQGISPTQAPDDNDDIPF
jgi:hypothetical protein